jgi:phage baseplate assembly protein W
MAQLRLDPNTEPLNEDFLGSDLALLDGDLVLDETGDYKIVEADEHVRLSIYRLLATPLNSIVSLTQDYAQLAAFKLNYGNNAFQYLSEPQTNSLVVTLREEIVQALRQEERITVLDASGVFSYDDRGAYITVSVQYALNYGNTTSTSLTVVANIASGTLEVVS